MSFRQGSIIKIEWQRSLLQGCRSQAQAIDTHGNGKASIGKGKGASGIATAACLSSARRRILQACADHAARHYDALHCIAGALSGAYTDTDRSTSSQAQCNVRATQRHVGRFCHYATACASPR